MSKVASDDFEPTEKNQRWARITFCITQDEVKRQTEMFLEHEFNRHYTHWQICWRRWIRKADEIQTMRRPHVPRTPEDLSEEQKEEDRKKGWENIHRLQVKK